MKSTIVLLLAIGFVCIDSRADDSASVQAKSSLKICNVKGSALADGGNKASRIDTGNKVTVVNACFARHFNASMKCHQLFIEGYDKAANEIKDETKLRELAIKSLKPDLKTCLTKANDSAMKDSERLFDLFAAGKKHEANALVDAWIKDGSGKIPQ